MRQKAVVMLFLRIVLISLGAFGVLDTFFVSFLCNMNLGVLMPGLLGFPLLLVGLFLPQWAEFFANGFGRVIKWLLVAGYGLFFVLFAVTSLLLHAASAQAAPPDADAVIVLGAGLRGDKPMLVLRQRMDTAIDYLQKNPGTVAILSGGKGEGESISEAEAMARYFKEKSVPASRYIKEDASTSTQENFLYSRAILRERFGPDAVVAFVTTDFHVYRAGRVAEKLGLHVYGIAAPDVWYLSLNNHLRECVAVWVYALTGLI
jgi:uncharacterized SAM-binding protein YcdF (DUF218 family)